LILCFVATVFAQNHESGVAAIEDIKVVCVLVGKDAFGVVQRFVQIFDTKCVWFAPGEFGKCAIAKDDIDRGVVGQRLGLGEINAVCARYFTLSYPRSNGLNLKIWFAFLSNI